jgi:hypothetical protein
MLGMARAQTVSIDVEFKFTDLDYKPLPRENMRVVFGAAQGWQNPDSGHKFVTDEKGEARFTTTGLVDKRWRSKPVGFTPFSVPVRTEHMMIAAELEHKLQLTKDGEVRVFHWVHTMDIDCTQGECATTDFTALYTPDATGRFTQQPPRYGAQNDGWKIPELKGMVLAGMGYQPWDFLMTPNPADPEHKRKLKLAFKRFPPPVWR